jgi:cell division protein FtsN
MLPEDRGPDSVRRINIDRDNPIHAGILANRENNPKIKVMYNRMWMPVKEGNEAEPTPSTRYPSSEPKPVVAKKTKPKYKPVESKKETPKVETPAPRKKAVAPAPAPKRMSNLERARLAEKEARLKGNL